MFKNSPQIMLPTKTPRLRRGIMNSPHAHAAISMLILGISAGAAMYLIQMRRARQESMTPEIRLQERIEHLEKLASHGSVGAQLDLASAYASGLGVPRDPAAAVRWNRAAADQQDPSAQVRLARAYSHAEGVDRNLAAAAEWARKAALQTNADAACIYGIYRFHGIGTPRDPVDGYRWLDRAAAAGSDAAAMALETARSLMTPEQLAQAQAAP